MIVLFRKLPEIENFFKSDVRGHYRKLKSGKVVYISDYKTKVIKKVKIKAPKLKGKDTKTGDLFLESPEMLSYKMPKKKEQKALVGHPLRHAITSFQADFFADSIPKQIQEVKKDDARAQVNTSKPENKALDPINNINAQHTLPLDRVLAEWKPRFRDSTPPRYRRISKDMLPKVYHVSGDLDMISLQASVTFMGEPDKNQDKARQILDAVKAAKEAGYEQKRVDIGGGNTALIFIKDGQVLTPAGVNGLHSDIFKRPDFDENSGYTAIAKNQTAVATAFAQWMETLPASTVNSFSALSTKINKTAIGNWAKLGRDSNGQMILEGMDADGKIRVRLNVGSMGSVNNPLYIPGAAEDPRALLHHITALADAAKNNPEPTNEREWSRLIHQADKNAAEAYKAEKSHENKAPEDIAQAQQNSDKQPFVIEATQTRPKVYGHGINLEVETTQNALIIRNPRRFASMWKLSDLDRAKEFLEKKWQEVITEKTVVDDVTTALASLGFQKTTEDFKGILDSPTPRGDFFSMDAKWFNPNTRESWSLMRGNVMKNNNLSQSIALKHPVTAQSVLAAMNALQTGMPMAQAEQPKKPEQPTVSNLPQSKHGNNAILKIPYSEKDRVKSRLYKENIKLKWDADTKTWSADVSPDLLPSWARKYLT